jgi:hypothetical protein
MGAPYRRLASRLRENVSEAGRGVRVAAMGDRSNLYLRAGDAGIGVYGHWAGIGMADAAAAVLANPAFQKRLGDHSYATRIAVQTAIGALGVKPTDETGCGLWTSATGPDDFEYAVIVIDLDSGAVYVTRDWENPTDADKVVDPTASAIAARMRDAPR